MLHTSRNALLLDPWLQRRRFRSPQACRTSADQQAGLAERRHCVCQTVCNQVQQAAKRALCKPFVHLPYGALHVGRAPLACEKDGWGQAGVAQRCMAQQCWA